MEVIYEDSNEEQNVSPDHKNKESQPKDEEGIQQQQEIHEIIEVAKEKPLNPD